MLCISMAYIYQPHPVSGVAPPPVPPPVEPPNTPDSSLVVLLYKPMLPIQKQGKSISSGIFDTHVCKYIILLFYCMIHRYIVIIYGHYEVDLLCFLGSLPLSHSIYLEVLMKFKPSTVFIPPPPENDEVVELD